MKLTPGDNASILLADEDTLLVKQRAQGRGRLEDAAAELKDAAPEFGDGCR